MPLKSNFKTIQILHENNSTIISRAIRLSDNKSVIIKQLKQSYRDEHKIYQFLNEEKILSKLNTRSIIKILQVVSKPSIYCHILEDIIGDSLYNIILKHKFSLEEALYIALNTMKALQYIHQNHIIHADINPKNIIYNLETRALQIIDFGISIRDEDILFNEQKDLNSSGNLFYIAPEQTGLTEYKIDYNSDTYSLGMSLYHIFLGKIPLNAKDQYELLHKQITIMPTSLHEVDIHIPKMISVIVDKMINKNPSNRYQSDEAIVYDLKKCIQTLDKFDNIKYFKIASLDKQNIIIGDKLFGRNKEIAILNTTLKNANKAPLRVIVSGVIGIGKTSLVNEFFKNVDTNKFKILIGKFDKYKGYLPHVGYRQIFSSLSFIISMQEMRGCMKKMHPNTPKILSIFFPELNKLFNTKTKGHNIADLLYTKAQLSFAISDLFKVIATKENPLIIFFDDIQWIDEASSKLLKETILNSHNPYIHFITTIREDKRDTKDKENINFLEITTEIKREKRYKCLEIKLYNLSKKDINKMLHIIMMQTTESLSKFATIVYKKTDGNPFYIKFFIEFLLDNKILYFDKGKWKYSISKIKTYNQTDNIIDLIRIKLENLSKEEKSYLQYLAILGNKFNLSLTIEIMNHYHHKQNIIKNIIKDGFVSLYSGTYQFSHDTIQQDIFTSIDKQTKCKIHKDIGLYLEKAYNANNYHDIIIVAYHLSRAYPLDKAPKRLFKLNIIAIKEMLNNSSYTLALSKIEWIDKTFFRDELWVQEYATAFDYSLLRAKVLYLNSKLIMANKQILASIEKAKNLKDRVICFSLLKDISVTRGSNFKKTLEFGNRLFKELGIEVPATKNELSLEVDEISNYILSHHLFIYPNELLKYSKLKKIKHKRISSLLVEYWEVAYYLTDIELMKWCFLNIVEFSFKYGHSSESAFGYALYGAHLVSQKEYKKAHLFGDIALKLNALFSDENMLSKVYNFVANFINPYTKYLNTNIKLYKQSLVQSKMDGNIVFGTWANFLMHFSDYLSGESLEKVELHINSESEFISNSGDEKMIAIFDVLKETVHELQTKNLGFCEDSKKITTMWQRENFYPALAWYAIIKAQLCFLNNEIEKGLNFLNSYVHSELNDIIMFPKINLHFIRAILLLQTNQELSENQKKILSSDLDELQTYYKTSPHVFRFYNLLLNAEGKKYKESTWDVAKKYDLAINQARKEKNNFFIAIANLSASRFWQELEYVDMRNMYLNAAISSLNQWGAFNVSNKLKTIINDTAKKDSECLNNFSSTSSSSRIKQSNFQILIKSYNAIYKSTNDKELIDTFMKIILQNATASSGVLLFKEKEDFFVNAIMDYTKDKFEILNEKLQYQKNIPLSLIQNVITMGENIILNHPSQSGKFQLDQYFKKYKPASVIAIPIKIEGNVSGVLYLQNNEIQINLSDETIKTLELLLTQVAIVFNNIRLYEDLRTNDENLNKAQELLHVGSWQFDSSNEKILWSAETYRIFDIEPFSRTIDYSVFLSFVHPDDLVYLTKAHEDAIKGNLLYSVEHRIITAKQNIKYVKQKAEISIKNGIEKMSGTIQDITKAKIDQEQIATLSQVIEQSPNAIVIADTKGNIKYTNKQFTTNTGYGADESVNKNMNILKSSKHSNFFYEDLWNTVLKDKKIWRGVIVDKCKNQKLMDLQTVIFPIFNSKDEIINLVSIQEDVTQRNLHEKLFLMQTRQAQMGEMISMIAHQWRQPLGAISATAISLEMQIKLQSYDLTTKDGQDKQNEHFLKQLKKIGSFVLGLSRTIDDFRNFYKPNKIPISETLQNVVLKSLNIIRSSLQSHNITLVENYNSSKEIKLYDSELIQVILNIIKNSQDAFEEKNIKNPNITISTQDDSIFICDNAGGIDQNIIDNIFEVYFSTKSEKNGTGLGLYMSKTIIEKHHNGTLSVKNKDDGVCFGINIGEIEDLPPIRH